MHIAIMSDIHGVITALDAVLEDIQQRSDVDEYLPLEIATTLPDGTKVLAVHAAPGRDTGLGIKVGLTEDELAVVLGDCDANLIFGGHHYRPVDVMVHGKRVIFDSPCFYTELLQRGQQMAAAYGARYCYIECVLHDLDELDRRLRGRDRMPSQVAGVYAESTAGSGKAEHGPALFRMWIEQMKRPTGPYVTIDTTQSIEVCVAQALHYVVNG